jgi:hypothetical protein
MTDTIKISRELPEVLFDGNAVYEKTLELRREKGLMVRTSAENVSDVLDAVVSLLRAQPPEQPGDGELEAFEEFMSPRLKLLGWAV